MPRRGASASAGSTASSTRLRRLNGASSNGPNEANGQEHVHSGSAKRKGTESGEALPAASSNTSRASAKRRRVATAPESNNGRSSSRGVNQKANNYDAATDVGIEDDVTAGSVAIGSTASAKKSAAASGKQQTSSAASKRRAPAKSSSHLESQTEMDKAAAEAVSDMEQARQHKMSESRSSVERRSSVEEMNLEDCENQIEDLLQNTSKGVTTEYLESHFEGPKHDMVKALNSLLAKVRTT